MGKQSKLTKAARGKSCTINLYPYCNENPETTVFAHMPSEDSGWGCKSPDWWGAYACSACHDAVDGRLTVKDIPKDEILAAFVRGTYRTLKDRFEEGLL